MSRIGAGRGIIAVIVLLALTALATQTCQQSQVKLSKEQAIRLARQQVDFVPRRTQVRLVRQGVPGRPYWAISLSIPAADDFSELVLVRVNAATGDIASVERQR